MNRAIPLRYARKEIPDAEENDQVQEMRKDIYSTRTIRLAHAEHARCQEEDESGQEGEETRKEADDEESWSSQRLSGSVWLEDNEPGTAHTID